MKTNPQSPARPRKSTLVEEIRLPTKESLNENWPGRLQNVDAKKQHIKTTASSQPQLELQQKTNETMLAMSMKINIE